MLLSNATFQLLSSEQRPDRLESDGVVKRIRYIVNGGGGGRGNDLGGANRIGKVERCVSVWEIVDTVGEVARRVCVSRIVWLVSSRRKHDWVDVIGNDVERESAVHVVRSAV